MRNLIGKYPWENKEEEPRKRDVWLVKAIKKVISTVDKVMLPYRYQFFNNRDSAKHNTKILKNYKYDFDVALFQKNGTIMEPGSKFRSTEVLKQ